MEARVSPRVHADPAPLYEAPEPGDAGADGRELPPLTFPAWLAASLRRWRIAAYITAAAVGLAVLAALVLPAKYRSSASFVSNTSGGVRLSGGAASAMSALGGGGGGSGALAGLASQFGLSGSSDPSESPQFYAHLIHSRELQTRLAHSRFPDPRTAAPADSATLLDILADSVSLTERVGLREPDPRRRLEKLIKQLDKSVISVSHDQRTGVVFVNASARWPELSAEMTNRIVGLVSSFNQEQRTSRVRAKRIFVEGRVDSAQAELTAAERALRQFYESNRSWRLSPGLVFEEGRLRRQVEVASDLYMTLRRELESARIAEVNDAPLITVVDSAVVPRLEQWPRVVPLLFTTLVVGGMLGALAAGIAALLADWARRNPDAVAELRQALRRAGGRQPGPPARPARPDLSA